MPVLYRYVSDEDVAKMERFSRLDGRSVVQLAEDTISDQASRISLPVPAKAASMKGPQHG